jgi:signal transduction histidine kinase
VFAEMQSAESWALVAQMLLAGIAALFTFAVTRRAVAPLEILALELGGRSVARGRKRTGSAEVTRLREAIAARLREEEARKLAIADLGEKERNALLAKLAAGLAHEVRNPLAGLLNAVSTLRRFGDKPEVRGETLDLIERGLRSIERVADAMLSTYRPGLGRMRFSHEDLVDIQLLVGPEARRRHLTLDWRVEGMRPIRADADALRQVLLNLLLNACKASSENGRVGLIVTQNERETEFAVADSGPGMPEDVLAFLEEGRMTTPLMRRKGLGLWMVSRLLDDLDGKIRVESRVGEGTRVVVRLPSPIDVEAEADDLRGRVAAAPPREKAG